MKSIILIGFLSILSITSSATMFSSQCKRFPSPLAGGYCIDLPQEGQSSGDIIYYLHGGAGSESMWQDPWYYTQQIRNEWQDMNVRLPIVVSVSYGPLWLLAEKNASTHSGLYNVFLNEFVPMIESSLPGPHNKRVVFGESMGGFNSIQVALRSNTFSKAAILCSPMPQTSPYSRFEELESEFKRTGAWQYYSKTQPDLISQSIKDILKLVYAFYPSPKDWQSADPITLARTSISKTDLYVSVGYYDKFAAYEGNLKFISVLRSHGRNVEWRPQWGGHCAIDIPSLARFLVE